MIEKAKKHANAPVPGPEAEKETAEEPVVEEAEAPETQQKEKVAEQQVEDEDEEDSQDPALVEMRRTRAQRILKALGAR